MDQTAEEKRKNDIREFRFSLIAELANPHLAAGELSRLLKEKALRSYQIPYSKKTSLGQPTIRRWLYLFKKYGKDALTPHTRSDTGKSRSISDTDKQTILAELKKFPQAPALSVVRKLKSQGRVDSAIKESSLFRFLRSYGLDRKSRIVQTESHEQQRRFAYQYPMECIQVDCLHGFSIPDTKGKLRKAILIACIDDATRRILFARFSFSEVSLTFEAGIKHILKTHGRILKLYTDNGSTFISRQTQRILDILGIPLIHSKPGQPRGRGKIERFFRTVRDQFLRTMDSREVTSIEELNMLFATWLETEYHRNPHNGLDGATPLDTWLSKTRYLTQIDQTIDLDAVFQHEEKRKVYRDATFTLNGVLYEVSQIFVGKSVSIRFDPSLSGRKVMLYLDGKYVGDAAPVDQYANTRVRRNVMTKLVETLADDTQDITGQQKTGVNTALISLNSVSSNTGDPHE